MLALTTGAHNNNCESDKRQLLKVSLSSLASSVLFLMNHRLDQFHKWTSFVFGLICTQKLELSARGVQNYAIVGRTQFFCSPLCKRYRENLVNSCKCAENKSPRSKSQNPATTKDTTSCVFRAQVKFSYSHSIESKV